MSKSKPGSYTRKMAKQKNGMFTIFFHFIFCHDAYLQTGKLICIRMCSNPHKGCFGSFNYFLLANSGRPSRDYVKVKDFSVSLIKNR